MNAARSAEGQVWHVLQRSDAVDEEMALGLSGFVPVILWEPDRSVLPVRPRFDEAERRVEGSRLRVRRFPLVRGFWRMPTAALETMGRALAARLAKHCTVPSESALVCTTSLFAYVADYWPGPVVYWLTDLMVQYDSLRPETIRRLDRQLCRRAELVCPNSERLATYLHEDAGCPVEKLAVIANAARSESIFAAPPSTPANLPADYEELRRPVAGVIGNLAENMDWVFLNKLIGLVPWLSWVFVGSTAMEIRDPDQRRARKAVMRDAKARFTGPRPHQELLLHARAIDVAVLPYRRREPTYSGSSTRFYEHLAACQPILATAGVAELVGKEPLLKLVHTPEEAAAVLQELRSVGFDDGLRSLRWQTSRENTWRERAQAMQRALEARMVAPV